MRIGSYLSKLIEVLPTLIFESSYFDFENFIFTLILRVFSFKRHIEVTASTMAGSPVNFFVCFVFLLTCPFAPVVDSLRFPPALSFCPHSVKTVSHNVLPTPVQRLSYSHQWPSLSTLSQMQGSLVLRLPPGDVCGCHK